ncbi:MAG: hypothetical protein OXI16_13500 [Chloroflexota bacterium]|nr:hypothetical protein [Chloroflexota bacterium]
MARRICRQWSIPVLGLDRERLRHGMERMARSLIASGVFLVILAQAYLMFVDNGGSVPGFAVIAMAVGIMMFALGVFARGNDVDVGDDLSEGGLTRRPLTSVSTASLGLGCLLTGILSVRLLAGSESGWDLILWLPSLGLFATPFLRRQGQLMTVTRFMREHIADVVIVMVIGTVFVGLNVHDLTGTTPL